MFPLQCKLHRKDTITQHQYTLHHRYTLHQRCTSPALQGRPGVRLVPHLQARQGSARGGAAQSEGGRGRCRRGLGALGSARPRPGARCVSCNDRCVWLQGKGALSMQDTCVSLATTSVCLASASVSLATTVCLLLQRSLLQRRHVACNDEISVPALAQSLQPLLRGLRLGPTSHGRTVCFLPRRACALPRGLWLGTDARCATDLLLRVSDQTPSLYGAHGVSLATAFVSGNDDAPLATMRLWCQPLLTPRSLRLGPTSHGRTVRLLPRRACALPPRVCLATASVSLATTSVRLASTSASCHDGVSLATTSARLASTSVSCIGECVSCHDGVCLATAISPATTTCVLHRRDFGASTCAPLSLSEQKVVHSTSTFSLSLSLGLCVCLQADGEVSCCDQCHSTFNCNKTCHHHLRARESTERHALERGQSTRPSALRARESKEHHSVAQVHASCIPHCQPLTPD